MKPKVYVLDAFHPAGVELITKHTDAVPFGDPRAADWHADADGVMTRGGKRLTEADFAKARKLKVVFKQGVGVDSIDLQGAKKHGIKVYNTPGINTESVAEITLGLMIAVGRRVAEFDRLIRSGGEADRSKLLGVELSGKSVAIVGMGNIGTRGARKLAGAFDVKLLGYDPYVPKTHWADIPHERVARLEDLLPRADVLTVHTPLNEETRGLIGKREMALMKTSAILINAARGGIVDEMALYDALKAGHLFGAGLDVFVEEPPKSTHPLVSLPNVIALPHVAGSTRETQERSSLRVAEGLIAIFGGKEPDGRVV